MSKVNPYVHWGEAECRDRYVTICAKPPAIYHPRAKDADDYPQWEKVFSSDTHMKMTDDKVTDDGKNYEDRQNQMNAYKQGKTHQPPPPTPLYAQQPSQWNCNR